MTIKSLDDLWRMYPASQLHCDVTSSGLNSYRVSISFLNSKGEVIVSIDHYGSDRLDRVKEQAIELLLREVQQINSV